MANFFELVLQIQWARAIMIRSIIISLAFIAMTLCAEISTKFGPNEFEENSSTEPSNIDSATEATYKPSKITRDGQEVSIDDYPYMVSLYDEFGEYICPGTIVTPKLILTATYCVTPDPPHSIRTRSEKISSGSQEYGEKYGVQEVINHPNASNYGIDSYDISLVVLQSEIPNAQAVELVDSNVTVPAGATVQALGWNTNVLSKANLEVSPDQSCLSLYSNDGYICTESHKTFVCVGDGGGPVIFNGQQVGVISHSMSLDCDSGVPAANVKVEKYLDWIKGKMASYV